MGNISNFFSLFQTMLPKQEISSTIISNWAMVLNSKEDYRSPGSPLRLFCMIDTTYSCLGEEVGGNRAAKRERFAGNMDYLLSLTTNINFDDVDMVFFPILAHVHYYIVCYNLKNPRIDIIDNLATGPLEKYGKYPVLLHMNFIHYMKTKKHPKVQTIMNIKANRMHMSWRTTKNSTDCGIFVMRHMETYKGDGLQTWNPGFFKNEDKQRKQILTLRKRYMYELLASPLNQLADTVLFKAAEFDVERKEKNKEKK